MGPKMTLWDVGVRVRRELTTTIASGSFLVRIYFDEVLELAGVVHP